MSIMARELTTASVDEDQSFANLLAELGWTEHDGTVFDVAGALARTELVQSVALTHNWLTPGGYNTPASPQGAAHDVMGAVLGL